MRWPSPFQFAIVDEIDFVLIDEGRSQLLISGEHYNVDLTEEGVALAEIILEINNLWDENDPWDELESHLQQKGIPVDIVCCLLHLEVVPTLKMIENLRVYYCPDEQS